MMINFYIPNHNKELREAPLIMRNYLVAEKIKSENMGRVHIGRMASDEEILKFHTEKYINALITGEPYELANSAFTWEPGIYEAYKKNAGAFLDAIEDAMQNGLSGVLTLGGHHAEPGVGGALSVFNEIGISVHYVKNICSKVFVLDLDMHFGNGTTIGFLKDEKIFLFDYHGHASKFFHPDTPHLFRNLSENPYGSYYLSMLKQELPKAFDEFKPDFCIYLSGMDVFLGSSNATLLLNVDDIAKRENFVFEEIFKRKIPAIYAHGGGYFSEETAANLHFLTAKAAKLSFDK